MTRQGEDSKDKGNKSGDKSSRNNPQGPPVSWDLESPFDTIVSLEELINRPPFKASSDKGGGSYTAAARIPFWLERKVMHLLEVMGSPYMLKSDVIRDAIYLGLRVLNMRHKTNPDWAVEAKMARTIDRINLLTRLQSQAKDFAGPTLELWEGGDEQQAREGVEEFVGAAVEIEDEWTRSKTLQLLKTNRQLRPVIDSCSEGVRRAVYGRRDKQ